MGSVATQFKKGVPRHPKAGRRKGTANKVPVDLAQSILDGAAKAKGKTLVDYFSWAAVEEPAAFLALIAKILPAKQSADLIGADQINEITINVVHHQPLPHPVDVIEAELVN